MKKDILVKAQSGDVEAMFRLAGHLYSGRGVEQSYRLAREWYEAAAEKGHAQAKYELGLMLVCALGGDADLPRAAQLFAEAAEDNVAAAKFELGAMYASGNGVKKNYVKAMKYLREARTYEAGALLDEAPKWWEAAAKQGITEAQYQFGLCYVNAYGFPQDYVSGRHWMLKAAQQGSAKAYDALSQIYQLGLGVTANEEKMLYFRKCYCDIKGLEYDEFGVTGDETVEPDDLNPDLIELPKYVDPLEARDNAAGSVPPEGTSFKKLFK